MLDIEDPNQNKKMSMFEDPTIAKEFEETVKKIMQDSSQESANKQMQIFGEKMVGIEEFIAASTDFD